MDLIERHADAPTPPLDGDERLVARLRAGEVAALEEVYEIYRRPVFGYLMRLARDRFAAEDLFQNTWIKISRSASRLREGTALRPWIFCVARNEFRSYRRWQLVDLSRLFLFRMHETRREDVGAPDESGAIEEIERAIALLGPADREVLLLVCVEELTAEEAALVLGVSYAALRQRLGRARARLKKMLGEAADSADALRPECTRTT